MSKHSHNDHPHRAWRSAGEKKCIESSTLRSIDIFDSPRPIKGTELLKVVEPAKITEPVASKAIKSNETTKSTEPAKVTESIKIEPKSSSSPRKERGKSHSHTRTKSPASVPQTRVEPKKSSTPIKKGNIATVKDKTSPVQRQNSKSTESTTVNHAITPLLTDSLKLVIDNNAILQRMKDIDLKIMELQVKKTVIDEQIHNLHKDKSYIDQTTIQLQNDRFLLLSSLLTANAVSQKKVSGGTTQLPPRNIDQKVVELSSDDEVMTTAPKKMSTKMKLPSASHNLKRKIDDDVKVDGGSGGGGSSDGTKCKKLKINLNALKPLTNSKSNAKHNADVDDVQSDLKTEMMKATRRCTVRLTKLSSKKIKLLIGKSVEIESDDGGYASFGKSRPQNNANHSHKTTFDGSFCGHKLPIVHLQVKINLIFAK